ncbi:MAG: M20/M25/M40 family metallo-hydrolase [Acidobacteriota bacterium]|nr:M20/M25/M40 family metallo-hydrolase [Acidobacteriota bacterium]
METSRLRRGRRQAARLALYGSLAVVTALAFALVRMFDRPLQPPRATERWIERDYENMPEVQLLQRYVQIDTTEETGDEAAGARFLAKRLAAAGIEAQVEVLGGKHANLYALLPGEDPHPLVLHSHLDVAAVDPKEWFSPPFAARIDRPWIYGRGVFDMKSIAIAQLLAMIDLKRSGKPLKRSVLLLGTGGEESGSELGALWVLARHPELVRSFWAVLSEGGAVEARARDDIKYWGTEFAQKRFAELWICGGSREELSSLRQTLLEAGRTANDLRLVAEARTHLAAYGPTRDSAELRQLLARPEELTSDLAAFRKLPDYLRSMLRDETVPFAVQEAPGGGFQMLVLLHVLPGEEPAAVRDRLVPAWMTHGLLTVFRTEPSAGAGSPTEHPVFREIQSLLREQYPGVVAGPVFLPWTKTDSRFFRAVGVPSYGFSPFLILSTDTLQVDKANERMSLPGYVQGVELYRLLVRRLVL